MRRPATLACLVVALLARAAAASPAEQFGFGPREQAMGATGAASGGGFGATFTNPALLSLGRRRQVSFGWQAARFDLRAEGPNAPGALHEEGLAGSFVGAVLPVPFGGALRDRIALGIGAFTPSELIVRARVPYPEAPQFPVLADRAQCLSLSLGAGADLGAGWRVGAGAQALAALVGTVIVRTEATGRTGTVVDDQLVATYAPILGVAKELGRGWSAGITFRGELDAEFDVAVRVQDLGSLTLPELHIAGVAQYDPLQVALEVAREAGPLVVTGGVTFKRWSAFDGWARPTVSCPAEKPDCAALGTAPAGFHDTPVPRLGVAWRLLERARASGELRAGAFFEPSPAPEQTRESNTWDSDRLAVTLGWGSRLGGLDDPFRLDVYWQHHVLFERTHTKDADVDPSNAGAPTVTTRGSVDVTGFVAGVEF
jgi:long-chain fatty acid transport protein